MSFSYKNKPGELPIDTIRFLVCDTDPNDVLLQDEEITYINNLEIPESKKILKAFEQCILKLSRRPSERRLGPQTEKYDSRIQYYAAQVAECKKLAKSGLPPSPVYQYASVFYKGMMSNVQQST